MALPAYAQSSQDIINQQDWITRQQQQETEKQKLKREKEAIKKDREKRKKERKKADNLSVSNKSGKCYPIHQITLIDANSLSNNTRNKLTKPFIGECVNGTILNKIISQIQNHYNQKGYIVAHVEVPQQNIQNGFLSLKIHEGEIEKIILGDNKLSDKMQKITAFGMIEGDVLNINDINQGIYQMNRLSSNKAVMKIEAGSEAGKSQILIENKNEFPAHASISYDNLGNEFSGIKRTNFAGNIDNILSLNDAINLNYSTNLDDNPKEKNIQSFSGGISIPLSYNTISYNYSHSEFRGTTYLIGGGFNRYTGYSNNNSLAIDRNLLSDGNFRLSTNLSLTAKSTASYINYRKQENAERKLTVSNFSLTLSNYFKNGVNLYLKPSYSRGLKILDAKKDEKDLLANEAKAQFDVFKFYLSLSKSFNIPKVNAPLTLSTEADSQFSKQTLFGSEQFAVGGYYSVRGFRENYITGDSGYYFRNKANVNLGSLILPLLPAKEEEYQGIFYKISRHLNKFSIEPFFDYGYTQNKYDGSDGRLSGAGITTIFSSKYFNASLTYSAVIGKSALITSEDKENKMIYFELSANCCS